LNQLEGLTILVDAARQLPESGHLLRALKWADRRLEVLKTRKEIRDKSRQAREARCVMTDSELARLAQANKERFEACGRCGICGYFKPDCVCSDNLISI
jgi:hypothetical protein